MKKEMIISLLLAILPACYAYGQPSANKSSIPGLSYFGRNGYIEYAAGNYPLIISVPHGGRLVPGELRDRSCGVEAYDTNTQELARNIIDEVHSLSGRWPHVVINRLHRKKLDANRALAEAVCGDTLTAISYDDYHKFISAAKTDINDNFGKGLFIDLHGHGHEKQRLEIGYLLSANALSKTDAELNQSGLLKSSSIRKLSENSGLPFSEILRGSQSLGAMFEEKGFPAVPSDKQPDPGNDPYFEGGFNTELHGSAKGGNIDGLQIECNYSGVRDNETNRKKFARTFAEIIQKFLAIHYSYITQVDVITEQPRCYSLYENYPNPFNPVTTINYQIAENSLVRLVVYNLLGQKVAILVNEPQLPGKYGIQFNASGLPSGIYIYRLETGSFSAARKMSVIK